MTAQDLAILTEYEVGRAVTAIEWVARSGKPIVEIGSRMLGPWELHHLAEDLHRCLDIAGELEVHGFIVLGRDDWWQFGFYRHAWAMAAFLYLQSRGPRIDGAHAISLQGLLFGYNAEAIQRFISSVSDARESRLHWLPYKKGPSSRRVETYDSAVSCVRRRSSPTGKCRPRG